MKKTIYSFSKLLLTAVSTTSLLVVGCQPVNESTTPTPATSATANARLTAGADYVPGELLIKFVDGTDADTKDKAYKKVKTKKIEKLISKLLEKTGTLDGIDLVSIDLDVMEAVSLLSGTAGVEYAEPNFIYQHTATSNDTYFTNGSLWGMYGPATSPANQFGSNAAAAWAAGQTGSATVYVGVIDEGVQVTHPDLSANIWVNPFDPVDGVDNDGNGYRDDRNGWDFAGNNNTVYDGGSNGRYDDHGTHVAGTIGGKGGNGVGVAGVTWTVKMISTKFLGAQGGTSANAVRAVDYLTDLKLRHGLNIVASNNSWGGGGYSQALFDAINRANNAGILFIAAAGNGGSDGVGDNNDVVASYPANYNLPNVISVAAITSAGGKSSFSNFGATTVDIGAPGSGVWSSTAFNTYSSYNGTS
ncbi:MAG: S8 family serine peptidase, partial [Bacteroidetes bacterium]|nr:S8 family serine peptidase [Fibrella sp.]